MFILKIYICSYFLRQADLISLNQDFWDRWTIKNLVEHTIGYIIFQQNPFLDCFSNFLKDHFRMSLKSIAVSNLLVAVNSTSNFFIYIWKGVQFRRQLQNKFTRSHHTSQYYNGPLHRNATTRATTRVTDVMEMNSVPHYCD